MGDSKDATEPSVDTAIRFLMAIENDLTAPLALALLTVARHPGLSVGELADATGMPQQTASRYVGTLLGRYEVIGSPIDTHKLPLLSLEVNQKDPRRRALFLTASGRSLVKKMILTLEGLNEKEHTSRGKS